MPDFETFRQHLQSALAHLHDPDFRSAETVYHALGCAENDPECEVQAALKTRIGQLHKAEAPAGSHAQQAQAVLHMRFILGLTQEEAAAQLNMSLRTLQRAQREAVYLLAAELWRGLAGSTPPDSPLDDAVDWRSQVRHEMAALQGESPDAEADLALLFSGVLRVASAAVRGGVHVRVQPVAPDLSVRFHPSVLRQVVLSIVSGLQERLEEGNINLAAERLTEHARITITGAPLSPGTHLDLTLAEELLAAGGGTLTTAAANDVLTFTLELPLAVAPSRRVAVLVIEDNVDLFALYRSYCLGTPYELLHVREGRRALAAVAEFRPDVILLDVMLPDVDGWDLLLDLRADPATSAIPIIVCSVVTDERLAFDLGAALYLRKPIWPERLLSAFETVVR